MFGSRYALLAREHLIFKKKRFKKIQKVFYFFLL